MVDHDGNASAVTASLGAQFLVIGDTGIHINNRMRMMSVAEGDPNRIEPGRRVRHTSNPCIATLNGRPFILGGNTGVDTQPQIKVQTSSTLPAVPPVAFPPLRSRVRFHQFNKPEE